MSVCTGIGNGIGGSIGKWGAGLGSALGLGAVVDAGVRAYTGYGLLETLSVPYIECPDGSFASAIEWYGSGLKCPEKKENIKLGPIDGPSTNDAALGYDDLIAAMGGVTRTFFGYHVWGFNLYGTMLGTSPLWEYRPEHYDSVTSESDKLGNVLPLGTEGDAYGSLPFGSGSQYGRGGYFLDPTFSSTWNGMSGGSFFFVNQRVPLTTRTKETLAYMTANGFFSSSQPWTYLGIQADIPANYGKAPPAANIPPPRGFSPPNRKNKEDCEEVSCCITPADIEKAIKKALGLTPFAPEKLIRELGAKMFAAPGPSLVPVVPQNLVEAIAALIAANYMRGGYGRYPVIMPDSLIASDNPVGDAVPTNAIENQAEWLEWIIKQKDAVDGEWPIDIAIVDGAKRQPLRFENISEAFAELAGLLIQAATDADAGVNAACTAAVAATKATNAAIVGQKNVECLIRFFGVRTGFKAVFVQSPITPTDPDDKNFNLRKFLTPSTQNLACLSDEDPFDFQGMMDRILRNTEVNRASVARSIQKDGLPGDFTRNQRKYDAAESKRETEKELEKLEQSIQAKNPDFKVKIKVDTPASDTIAGDNFVIKRSKN